jgi:hypothetical protein
MLSPSAALDLIKNLNGVLTAVRGGQKATARAEAPALKRTRWGVSPPAVSGRRSNVEAREAGARRTREPGGLSPPIVIVLER